MKCMLVLVLLFLLFPLKSEVFSLIPFRGNSKKIQKNYIAQALDGVNLTPESLEINGISVNLKMRLIAIPLENCTAILLKAFQKINFFVSENSIMADFNHKDGSLERIYLIALPGGPYPVIQFSINFPNGLPKNNGQWCENLPLPAQAGIKTSMYFPKRKLKYGTFYSYRNKTAIEEEITNILENNGWSLLSQGIFLNKNTKSMMLFTLSDPDKKGKITGFIIEKPFIFKK